MGQHENYRAVQDVLDAGGGQLCGEVRKLHCSLMEGFHLDVCSMWSRPVFGGQLVCCYVLTLQVHILNAWSPLYGTISKLQETLGAGVGLAEAVIAQKLLKRLPSLGLVGLSTSGSLLRTELFLLFCF